MKKGFFNLENEDGYDFLETLNVNDEEVNALYYLHGICHEFALALNKILGYEIVLWINYDEEVGSNVLIHAFNMFKYNGSSYYVDVRGVTDNLEDIIDEFEYYENLVGPFGYENEKARSILKKLGLNTDISNDIYDVINCYRNYYEVS